MVSDVLGSTLADSLIVRSQVLAGLAEGNADVNALIGHHVRLFAEAGHGGDGGSSNTEFDADGNSLFDTGLPSASGSGNDRTPGQAGAVYIQPNSSGGRGGDALLVNGNIKGDIVILADRRVTVETAAGHGVSSLVTSRIGHSTALFAATQRGGDAGSLYEAPDTGATYDGGIVNVNGADSAGNASPASFGHILIDGNQDDEFNLAGNGDANSTNGEDGIAVTEGDIENRTGSTFDSIASDPRLGQSLEGSLPNNTTGVIFHDEEADPQFIIDPSTGLFVANNAANNATYANDPVNLGRYGRLVEVYDGYTDENFGDKSMRVFVDMDQDGDVDLVDFDRDGRLDIVDIDGDGRMDQIDGRANYVGYFNTNEITGLGVLDYAAVSGQGFDANELEGGWTLRNELATSNLIAAYNGIKANRFTSLVGDFSNANGGRGGDAYTQVGYSSGDISITTGDNDLGEATSLVVSVNLLDDPVAGGDDDQHTAAIGHGAYQFSDAAAQVEMYRTGRVGSDGDVLQDPADGGSAGNFAINASGGRGGDAYVVQGELRDNNPDRDANDFEVDHLVGNIFINTPNALNGGQASPYAKRIDITAFVDNDYGSNFANAAIGHGSNAFAYGGSGGSGASYGSPTGPDEFKSDRDRQWRQWRRRLGHPAPHQGRRHGHDRC